MKKYIMLLVVFILFPISVYCNPAEKILSVKLQAPSNALHCDYLGINNGGSEFFLEKVLAKVLIIEIFSMYCPVCQREASNVNKLFELIQADPKLKDSIKLIGIGAGNTKFEVDFFKEKYNIKFPLFNDEDFSIHKQIGQVRTPYFIGLKRDGQEPFQVFYSQTPDLTNPGDFLKTLLGK